MKKAEIATKVFEAMDAVPLSDLVGGALKIPITDLAGLSLVPWFCDVSVQWALRLAIPGTTLKKSLLKKVNGSFVTVNEVGAFLVGVPGDGIEPSTFVPMPLVEAVAQVAQPGMKLELATANLGVVKRDWDAKAETDTSFGNQRYLGTIEANVNPLAVKRFIGLKDGAFRNSDPGMTRKLCGLGLGFFRHRLGGGPFRWPAPGPTMNSEQQLEDVARVVVG